LHDKSSPERIYRVLTGQSCGGRHGSPIIERQKDEIKEELRHLANRLDRATGIFTPRDNELLALFPEGSGSMVRKAADGIRCQSGNRDRFYKALERYDIYGGLVRYALRRAGLPIDIQYLPFVESLYNPASFSRVGAAGLWQIMPGTAKGLGLKLTATLDERLDPELASYAASEYLSKSYLSLMAAARKFDPKTTSTDVSPFVITSYNYGVNGMRRAIEKYGPNYSVVIDRYRSPTFQVAVKNFYASFLAARYVAKNADRYFGHRSAGKPLSYQTVLLHSPLSLGRFDRLFGLSRETLREYNPALTRFVWQGWRLIPAGYRLRLPGNTRDWSGEMDRLRTMVPESDEFTSSEYIVKNGDTACAVAIAFQIPCQDLVDLNLLGRKATIRVGQKLQIPPSGDQEELSIVDPGSYRVRKGDSACGIAQKFGLGCREILLINGLTRNSILQVDQHLLIPGVSLPDSRYQPYVVRRGDSACLIAARFRIPCARLLKENGLHSRALIFPGQTLRVPYLVDRQTTNAIEKTRKISISHTVQLNDTVCEIAERYMISCKELMLANQLNSNGLIRLGQVLLVPEVSLSLVKTLSRREILAAHDVQHTVRLGETACGIARKYRIRCTLLISANKLDEKAIILTGEELIIPGATIEQLDNRFEISVLDQKIDLSVQTTEINGQKRFRINTEPEETLQHYADWLQISDAGAIGNLNNITIGESLFIGDALFLPITSQKQLTIFERYRQDYHRMLVEEFKETFEVSEVQNYSVMKGESLWTISRKFDLPVWIVTRYNPSLRSQAPQVGDELQVPIVETRFF